MWFSVIATIKLWYIFWYILTEESWWMFEASRRQYCSHICCNSVRISLCSYYSDAGSASVCIASKFFKIWWVKKRYQCGRFSVPIPGRSNQKLLPTASHHCDVFVLPRRYAAQMGPATRYTHWCNTASIIPIGLDFLWFIIFRCYAMPWSIFVP